MAQITAASDPRTKTQRSGKLIRRPGFHNAVRHAKRAEGSNPPHGTVNQAPVSAHKRAK